MDNEINSRDIYLVCSLCDHTWGRHKYNPPHGCVICECKGFVDSGVIDATKDED